MVDTTELKEQSQWMEAHIKWLKRQVREIKERKYPVDQPTNIDREIFAAEMELQDYVKMLKENGYKT